MKVTKHIKMAASATKATTNRKTAVPKERDLGSRLMLTSLLPTKKVETKSISVSASISTHKTFMYFFIILIVFFVLL
jgi:hypothetical protein